MSYLSTWDANLYIYRVLTYSKVWNFWLKYKFTGRKEQKQGSSTGQVGPEPPVATGQALPSLAGPKHRASICDGQSREITGSTDHPGQGKAKKQVHGPARTSVLNPLPEFFIWWPLPFYFWEAANNHSLFTLSLQAMLCIPFSCYLFSRMKSFNQFNLLLFSSQIWSSLLPTSIMFSAFMCLSWDTVTRSSIQDANTLLHTVI